MLRRILANPLPDEKPILFLRRHWFVLTQRILRFVVLLLLPFMILGMLALFNVTIRAGFGDPLFAVIMIAVLMYAGGLWLSLFTVWLDYSLDVWLVTNYRIISVEQQGLFSRVLSENRLDRVQDVTSEVHGFVQTMAKYGNVYIQTAGEHPRSVLKQIPNPTAVARRIIELQNDALARSRGRFPGGDSALEPYPIDPQKNLTPNASK